MWIKMRGEVGGGGRWIEKSPSFAIRKKGVEMTNQGRSEFIDDHAIA